MKFRLVVLPVLLLGIVYSCNAQTTHEADLSWGASPTPGATYNVRRGTVAGGPKTVIKAGNTTLSFVDSGLAANTHYCYEITVSAVGFTDSVPTPEVCGTTGQDSSLPAGSLTVVFK